MSRPAKRISPCVMRPGGSGDQAQYRQRADGLAGAAFAHDRHSFARLDGVRDTVNRAHQPRTRAELGVEILHF